MNFHLSKLKVRLKSFIVFKIFCSQEKTPFASTKAMKTKVTALLYDDFETLDAFGPIEIFGQLPALYEVALVSLEGGLVSNRHGLRVHTEKIPEKNTDNILLLPGGWGVREYINQPVFLEVLKTLATESRYVLSVCNGSALLGKTGLLTGRKATTNKGAFHWVTAQCPDVQWQKKARWVVDGTFYTSSGVSAGMDMTLGFLRDQHGLALAEEIAREIEYRWQQDKDKDDFEIA